jgi:hypothetical protein
VCVLGPRPRAAAHMAIRMLGHPYAQEPALLARFTPEGRAAAGLSHPRIVAVFDSGSQAGTIWSWRAWKRNPRRPHQHRGVLGYNPPGGKAGVLVAELIKDPTNRSGGRSTASARSWSAASSAADRAYPDVPPQLVSGPPSFAIPSLEQSDG